MAFFIINTKPYPPDERIIRIDDFKWYELPVKWMMMLLGWRGYTSPSKYYYYIGVPTVQLKRHEKQHGVQMYRDGTVTYHFVYAYHFTKGIVQGKGIRQAYLDIPYEIEARESENDT